MSSVARAEPAGNVRLLRRSDLATLFGVNVATIAIWEREGKLPRAIRLSARSLRWRSDAIERLIGQVPELTESRG